MTENMRRVEDIAAELPEAERVDIAEWGNHPTFRVRGKNFVFADAEATSLSFKLGKSEAEAVIATEPDASASRYGLGRHGWVNLLVQQDESEERWAQIREWIRTSYTLVAPRKLAREVAEADGLD